MMKNQLIKRSKSVSNHEENSRTKSWKSDSEYIESSTPPSSKIQQFFSIAQLFSVTLCSHFPANGETLKEIYRELLLSLFHAPRQAFGASSR